MIRSEGPEPPASPRCPTEAQMSRNFEPPPPTRALARGASAAEGDPHAGSWKRKHFGGPYIRKQYRTLKGCGRPPPSVSSLEAPLLTNATVALLNPTLVSPSSAQSPSQPHSLQGKSSLPSLPHKASATCSPHPRLPPCFTILPYRMACSVPRHTFPPPGLCSAVTSS